MRSLNVFYKMVLLRLALLKRSSLNTSGRHLTCSVCILIMSEPQSKKPRTIANGLREDLLDDNVANYIKKCWKKCGDSDVVKPDGVEVICNPFNLCIVRNFLRYPDLLKSVVQELKDVTFHEKSNDLYNFKHSDDVQNLTGFTHIPELYDLLKTDTLEWLKKIFPDGNLKVEISATFSSYKFQDRLLCHDDKCEDRHVAFILYLVEEWSEEDGGALQLFDRDSDNHPYKVIRSIVPEFNTMIFFEVTFESYHQVAEVLSHTKERLSINGWFHSNKKKLGKPNCNSLKLKQTFGNDEVFNLDDFVLFTYLQPMNKADIKSAFQSDSEIQLQEFFVPKYWEEIQTDFQSSGIKWNLAGPANVRKYEVAETSTLPQSLKTLNELFISKCWFKFLKSITGVDLVPSEISDLDIWQKGNQPFCNFEIQKWTHSNYSLINDQDPEFHTEALDVILRIPFDGKDLDFYVEEENDEEPKGGHIIYLDSTSKDNECLLQIGHKMNSLALIYRDTKTLRYTKYLDQSSKPFYQIFCTYRPWTPPSDNPHLKHCEESESEASSYDDFEE